MPRRFGRRRIEWYPAGTAGNLVRARRGAGGQERQMQLDAAQKLRRDIRANRQTRISGAQRILECGVEETLVPEQLGFVRQPRTLEQRSRRVIASKRPI